MSAEGAFWLYDARDDKWQYFLVTSLFDSIGSREMYLRLNEALAKTLSERELRDFTFYIAGPREKIVKDVGRHIKTAAHASEPISVVVSIGGRQAKACVYRLAASLGDVKTRRVQRGFRRRTNELTAA